MSEQTTFSNRNRPVSISLMTDTAPDVCQSHEFVYDREYFQIPGCPSPHDALKDAGFSDKEIETAWIAFKKYAEKCVTPVSVKFTNSCNRKYNVQNGYVAYGTDTALIVVCDVNIVLDLVDKGFKLDHSITVPFGEHEAYYDKTTGSLLTWW